MAARTLPTVEELNAMPADEAARALEAVFERAPALALRVASARPYRFDAELLERARAELVAMSERERIAVLDAHPRIGAPAATLSDASRREQGASAAAGVEAELARLNQRYERRFGFRFVTFVAGRSRAAVLDELRERIGRERGAEMARGLEAFLAIARDRLGPLV